MDGVLGRLAEQAARVTEANAALEEGIADALAQLPAGAVPSRLIRAAADANRPPARRAAVLEAIHLALR